MFQVTSIRCYILFNSKLSNKLIYGRLGSLIQVSHKLLPFYRNSPRYMGFKHFGADSNFPETN